MHLRLLFESSSPAMPASNYWPQVKVQALHNIALHGSISKHKALKTWYDSVLLQWFLFFSCALTNRYELELNAEPIINRRQNVDISILWNWSIIWVLAYSFGALAIGSKHLCQSYNLLCKRLTFRRRFEMEIRLCGSIFKTIFHQVKIHLNNIIAFAFGAFVILHEYCKNNFKTILPMHGASWVWY